MGILEMDFERILGVPFFHSSFHSIMLWLIYNYACHVEANENTITQLFNKNS